MRLDQLRNREEIGRASAVADGCLAGSANWRLRRANSGHGSKRRTDQAISVGRFISYDRVTICNGEGGTRLELFLAGVAENADLLAVLTEARTSL